jgi:hypothetical protein
VKQLKQLKQKEYQGLRNKYMSIIGKKKKMLYSLSLSTSLSLATDESSKVSSALETFDHPLPLPEVDKTVEIELPDGESIKRSSFSEVASLDFDSFSDYTYTKKQKKTKKNKKNNVKDY